MLIKDYQREEDIMKTLIIDNYDSFTYNLYQMFYKVSGEEPIVIKNDKYSWQQIENMDYDNVVISPGPGNPEKTTDFGVCGEIIKKCKKPILGICLGHQGIYSSCGGKIVNAPVPMHGRVCKVHHNSTGLLKGIPTPFACVRYHSLMCDNSNVPSDIEIIARTEDNIIMGIRHKHRPIWGVQFHPESICSEYGNIIAQNFLELTHEFNTKKENKILFRKMELPDETDNIFRKLSMENKYIVWLDSSRVIEGLSRFSYIGEYTGSEDFIVKYYQKEKIIKKINCTGEETINGSIFDFINFYINENAINFDTRLPFDFQGGFVGYFGYELKEELLEVESYHSRQPDAEFLFLNRYLVIDHKENNLYLVYLTDNEEKANSWFEKTERKLHKQIEKILYPTVGKIDVKNYKLSRDKEQYIADIIKCQDYLKQGESYEICLTNKIEYADEVEPLKYYLTLRHINPAPYSAYLKFEDDFSVACSSMERFLKIDRRGIVQTKPIKGTLPRGKNQEEDIKNQYILENDEKYRSENLMIVDLLRNDLGIVCQKGSVHVPVLMKDEIYETVHQLVSTIEGKLKKGCNAIDCIKATFPGGSMTGAPKKRTLELIDTMEKEYRGIYSGTIGFLSLNGTADFNIVIRTAVIEKDKMTIGVGGAITIMSDAEEEFEEILLKGKALMNVVDSLEGAI